MPVPITAVVGSRKGGFLSGKCYNELNGYLSCPEFDSCVGHGYLPSGMNQGATWGFVSAGVGGRKSAYAIGGESEILLVLVRGGLPGSVLCGHLACGMERSQLQGTIPMTADADITAGYAASGMYQCSQRGYLAGYRDTSFVRLGILIGKHRAERDAHVAGMVSAQSALGAMIGAKGYVGGNPDCGLNGYLVGVAHGIDEERGGFVAASESTGVEGWTFGGSNPSLWYGDGTPFAAGESM